MSLTTGRRVSPPLLSLNMEEWDMLVHMNNKSCFLASCRELSFVLNSHLPGLSGPCGDVTEGLLVWERESDGTDRNIT